MDTEARRRQLGFRAWHRGTREADLLVGRFADHYLARATPDQLEVFGALLDENDPDIYDWVTDKEAIPTHLTPALQALLSEFKNFLSTAGAVVK